MKRRRAIQSILGLPVATQLSVPARAQYAQSTTPEAAKLAATSPDAVGDGVRHFLSSDQMGALEKLCDLIVPAAPGLPGALAAEVPAFLDFLLSASPAARQALYRNGLDRLNTEASRQHNKPFAQLSAAEATPLLAPLNAAWTYTPPADPFARFLREAKDDIFRATENSRQRAEASAAGRRRSTGLNTYWHVID